MQGRRQNRGRPKKAQTPKKRRLNLRRIIEFKYEMDNILKDLPENVTGTLKGSIIAKADKIDQDAAFDFIEAKTEDGTIDEKTRDRLGRLIRDFCVYR